MKSSYYGQLHALNGNIPKFSRSGLCRAVNIRRCVIILGRFHSLYFIIFIKKMHRAFIQLHDVNEKQNVNVQNHFLVIDSTPQ